MSLQPSQLTVLVGPNASGKSNLVDAFDFLGDVHRSGLEIAITRKGGLDNLLYRRQRRSRRLEMSVLFMASWQELKALLDTGGASSALEATSSLGPGTKFILAHSFEVRPDSEELAAEYSIDLESLAVLAHDEDSPQGDAHYLTQLIRTPEGVSIPTGESPVSDHWAKVFGPLEAADARERLTRGTRPSQLMAEYIARLVPPVDSVSRALAQIRVYRFEPTACRASGAPTPYPELQPTGENLPAVVYFLRKTYPECWARVLRAMRHIMPGLQEIETPPSQDRRLTLTFTEEGVRRPWTSFEVSDGTIRALALFVGLYDPRYPLLLVEEPENAVHSWILRHFIDQCRDQKDKQVLVTTHSPTLLSYLAPSEVTVVWRHDGRTEARPLTDLDRDAERLWADGVSSVFEILDSGAVREAVPGFL